MCRHMTCLAAALLIVAALTGSARAGGTSLHIGKTRTAVVDIIVQDGIAIPVTIQLPHGRRFSVGDVDDDEYDLDDIYNYGDPDQYEYPAPSGPKEDKSDIDVRSRKAMDSFFTQYYRRRQGEGSRDSVSESKSDTTGGGARRTASRRIGPMVKTMLGDLRVTEDDDMVFAVSEYGQERLYRLESDGEARKLVAQANGQQVRAVLIGRVRGGEDAPVVDVRSVWLRQPSEESAAEPEEGAEAADESESEGEQEPEPQADMEPEAE